MPPHLPPPPPPHPPPSPAPPRTPPPSSAHGACTIVHSGEQCVLECDGIGSFDLNGFRTASGQPYVALDSSEHIYYFQPCTHLETPACADSWVRNPMVVQLWDHSQRLLPRFRADSCAALGDEFSAVCVAAGRDNVTCTYTGGDGGRTVRMVYVCGPQPSGPQPGVVSAQEDLYGTGSYTIQLTGPAGCAASNHRERDAGRSWGQQGYFDELANTTTYLEALQRLEELLEHDNPGAVIAAIVISSTLACCLCLCVCYLRSRLRRQAREFEERLRLVSATKEVNILDDDVFEKSTFDDFDHVTGGGGGGNGFKAAGKGASSSRFGDDDGL